MKTVTILMTKDEIDIIKDCLEDRIKLFDIIAIVDSSTDGATEIISDYVKRYPDKFLYKYDSEPHTIKHHREVLFSMLKGKIDNSDWIWQLDTDIYFSYNHDALIDIQKIADAEKANCMICRIAQFYPTNEDILENIYWKHFQYYSLNWRSKIVYKGLTDLYFKGANQETPTIPNEKKATFSPIVRHYQYRSLPQIQKKIDRAYGVGAYGHIISKNCKDYIIDKEFLSNWNDLSWRRPHHSWRSLVLLTKEANMKKT